MRISAIQATCASIRGPGALMLLAALGLPGASGRAQTVDAGTLVILSGATVVGREEFTVRRGQTAGPGFTITTRAWYPAARPAVTLTIALELGADSLPTAMQLDVTGPDERRVYVVFGPRRVTVRSVRPNREAAREYPGGGRYLVADDSAFALHALVPRGGGEFAAMAPRADRREPATAIWAGTERTLVGGVAHTLERVTLRQGSRVRHLWYDGAGRLMKAEDTGAGLVAERQEGPR